MGRDHLRKREWKESWTPENPTRNYCYVVSECIYYYVAPRGATPYKLKVEGDEALHRFLKWPDGRVCDLTVDQFDDYALIKYAEATPYFFMNPKKSKLPSKRAQVLADLLALPSIPEWRLQSVNTKQW
jgi:hypothetical protein